MKVKNQYLKILSARIQMFPYSQCWQIWIWMLQTNVNQALYFPAKKKNHGLHMSKYVLGGPSSGWTTLIVLTTGYFN